MTNTKAQVGDLIRIVNAVEDEPYENGDIFEVTELAHYPGDVCGVNPKYDEALYIEEAEFVIHRKAGEEDSEKPCEKCASFTGTDNEGSFCSRECIERMQRKHVPAQSDAVNSPNHYTQGRYEVIDIIEDAVQGADPFEAVCQANILKYTLRYRAKNGVEDLRKSVWYANRLIEYLDVKSTQ